jgi:galactitol PTS system EIIC component
MEQVFSYIISLGASVMMPIIFTVIGLCIGMKFGKALKSGLFVGVGFVGLGVVTALLTTNFNDPLKAISDIYHLQLNVFDMGWPAAAAVAYNTAVGALIIPICLGVNLLMLLTKTTRTVNIDLWNYWHFAFIGAVAYFVMGESLAWGYFAAIICYIITLVFADLTAEKFQKYYDLDGISIPQPIKAPTITPNTNGSPNTPNFFFKPSASMSSLEKPGIRSKSLLKHIAKGVKLWQKGCGIEIPSRS